jgi:hypothetical protein
LKPGSRLKRTGETTEVFSSNQDIIRHNNWNDN